VLILGVDLADHTAANIALRLDPKDHALAERIGLAIDSDRGDLVISPDEARALLAVLTDSPAESSLRDALNAELEPKTSPTRGFGRWGQGGGSQLPRRHSTAGRVW
jgi:hypothetical protein